MDGYEHLDLDEIDFAPMEHDTERLRLLTLDEAYELIRVLRTAAEDRPRPAQILTPCSAVVRPPAVTHFRVTARPGPGWRTPGKTSCCKGCDTPPAVNMTPLA
ncbi:DUF6417 family protein [Streptomyces sp. NPDC058295]|uniref:DUF6417 family protein n=1 Tax=Streptomyces sp. NPDC058295 TaxID=3346431 RepID=UPI0036ED51DB